MNTRVAAAAAANVITCKLGNTLLCTIAMMSTF